ncbi:MAG: histidine phosphatase family protein [Eubacteriaceae bacterium]|nr:histidine phosphatase family protein [Eubacteriaceae bacterium]
MNTVLYLIRHGRTRAVDEHIYCGWTDLPLSERGIAEIRELAAEGIYPAGTDIYFTSGMKRCNETLQLIFGEQDYTSVPDIMEMNFGDFELHAYEELKKDPDYCAWLDDFEVGEVKCRGGESNNEFYERSGRGFMSILTRITDLGREDVKAAVVCHGGSIGGFMRRFVDSTLGFYDAIPSPGRGYRVELELGEEAFRVKGYEKI